MSTSSCAGSAGGTPGARPGRYATSTCASSTASGCCCWVPPGAGKSTLLAALAGLLAEDSGEQEGAVLIDGGSTRAPAGRRHRLPGPADPAGHGPGGDDVAFGLENRGVPARGDLAAGRRALAGVGFPYGRDRLTDALSGGEQQRLALAGVLAAAPGLLLLDEPTANLDPAGAALVREALAPARATRTPRSSSSSTASPRRSRWSTGSSCSRPGGGVLADGTPATVFATHGAELADAGVWVPGTRAAHRPPRRRQVLVRAADVTAGAAPATDRLVVRAGEALAVTGPNGAGKSTLALLLGGLLAAGERAASRRRRRAGTAAPVAGADAGHPDRLGVPEPGAPVRHRAGSRDELALGPRRTGQTDVVHRGRRCSPGCGWTGSPRPTRTPCPAASSGGSAWPPRWPPPRELLILDEPTFGQDRRTWRRAGRPARRAARRGPRRRRWSPTTPTRHRDGRPTGKYGYEPPGRAGTPPPSSPPPPS